MSIDTDRMTQIDKILENEIVNRSSFFQLQHFIIGMQPTTQSKLWQCLRELKRKRDAINYIKLEIEEMNDNIALAEIDIEKIEKSVTLHTIDPLYIKEKEINLRKAQRKIDASKSSLKDLEKRSKEELEEASFYAKAFVFLNEQEPLRPFDDPGVQRDYWNEKLTQDLNLSLIFKRPISLEVVKSIFALNDDAPIKKELINIVGQIQLEDKNKIKQLEKGE
jgi:hypothetical protein